MPFSRQHTLTALSFMPLVPWALKVKFVQASGAQVHSLQRCLMQWQAGSMLSMLPLGRVSLPASVCCSAVTAARHTPAAPPPLSALPLCARCSSDCSGGSRSSSSTRWGWATCRPPARWTSRTGQVGEKNMSIEVLVEEGGRAGLGRRVLLTADGICCCAAGGIWHWLLGQPMLFCCRR